ncbi:unnamed protein product, partial [Discosporangium mesarthrocarpum]
SVEEWCTQVLAVLLAHGRPYHRLLEEKGVLTQGRGRAGAGAGAGLGPGSGDKSVWEIPYDVAREVEEEPDYNCHRRCVFILHAADDLDRVAQGLLAIMTDARLSQGRGKSPTAGDKDALLIFSAFVHENPVFLGHIAGSEDLAAESAVCVCHLLQDAAIQLADLRADDAPSGEDLGIGVVASRVLLALSSDPSFLAVLHDTAATEIQISLQSQGIMEERVEDNTTLLDLVVTLACWVLWQTPAKEPLSFLAPAMAGIFRNASPVLDRISYEASAWLVHSLQGHLRALVHHSQSALELQGGRGAAEETRAGA